MVEGDVCTIAIIIFAIVAGYVYLNKQEGLTMTKDLLDIGIEFLREYINATPEERQRFTSQINDMVCSSDELLEAVKKLGEMTRAIKTEE